MAVASAMFGREDPLEAARSVIAGYVIDDNLAIPIGAGVAMWLALQLPI
jgi:dolichol kinase